MARSAAPRHERFQSTLPAWGETPAGTLLPGLSRNFNPLSPHGERLHDGLEWEPQQYISIHSPRMGRDRLALRGLPSATGFQSTLPAWGETSGHGFPGTDDPISIHSPRMGRDAAHGDVRTPARYFNPLSPHGERPRLPPKPPLPQPFQSTLPAWGETAAAPRRRRRRIFQSTLPAWGETEIVEPTGSR